MSFRQLLQRWRGVVLCLVGVVATLWLGATGGLALYIHPRYFVFAVVMAVIAALLVLAAFAIVPAREHNHEGHSHKEADSHVRRRRLTGAGSALIIAAAVAALLVLPPSTLSTATVTQRGMNGSTSALPKADTAKLVGADSSSFTFRDWVSLLQQGAGTQYLEGKQATVSGLVTPDKSDPENVFFVARFVVTCCAVDAQPIGLPVYRPGWKTQFQPDSWVEVSATFRANPTTGGNERTVLLPATIIPIERPAEPYVY